jgi:hypothetical protein
MLNQLNPNDISTLTWAENLDDMLVNVEVLAHAYFSEDMSTEYHRYNILTSLPLDDVEVSAMDEMQTLGLEIVNTY